MTPCNAAPAVPISDPDGAVQHPLNPICPKVRFDPRERALVALLRRAGIDVTRRNRGARPFFGGAAAGHR